MSAQTDSPGVRFPPPLIFAFGLLLGWLAGVVRRRYSKWVLWGACGLLIVANVINIAADLGGMADVTQMITGVKSPLLCAKRERSVSELHRYD